MTEQLILWLDTESIKNLILTFLGGVITGIIMWWSSKTLAEKIDTLKDGAKIVEDGKIEPSELESFVNEHVK